MTANGFSKAVKSDFLLRYKLLFYQKFQHNCDYISVKSYSLYQQKTCDSSVILSYPGS